MTSVLKCGRLYVRPERVTVNGQAFEIQQETNSLSKHAASRVVKVFHQIFARGSQIRDHGSFSEIYQSDSDQLEDLRARPWHEVNDALVDPQSPYPQ